MTQGWQPIETAPKDRCVLVFDEGYIGIARWEEDAQAWFDAPGGEVAFDLQPTHWMPLPDPPSMEVV